MNFKLTDSIPDRVRHLLGGRAFEDYELLCTPCGAEIPTLTALECPNCQKSWGNICGWSRRR